MTERKIKRIKKTIFVFEDGAEKILTADELEIWEKIQLGLMEGAGLPANEKQRLTSYTESVLVEQGCWEGGEKE